MIEELEAGNHSRKQECLRLIQGIALLPIPDPIVDSVDAYIQHHLMPNDPKGDALHLAVASYHRCQFLLTWNCAPLANANKREYIRHVNALLGLHVPILTTPLELIEEPEDDG